MIIDFNKRATVLIILSAVLYYTGCNKKVEQIPAQKIPVAASIAPQKYFIDKIGGDYVDVTVMVAPGASPHVYEPRPSQIRELSGAKLYFAIGIEFERVWLPRFAGATRGMSVIHLDDGVEKIFMAGSCDLHGQSHDDHEHTGQDPHIWLSPQIVKGMAGKIAAGLCSVDSLHCAEYMANKDLFIREIDTLQKQVGEVLTQSGITKIMVFHPSWGYFAREFNLVQIPIELEGKEPHSRELASLIQSARAQNIKIIFTQPQFSDKIARTIASQIKGTVVPIDPLAYDWENNLRTVAGLMAGE